ncbi:flagellar biosynthetic protein FliO [Salibacterium aidingense]|uniref:flagellar biosynthetic protein FliO n=1 Tax=Salibacterium aidingense TaxID=384933 RepID=UPI000420922C|nr:flagellar biosynthetic protein FliO [Salibacterium aidingense]
MKLKQKWVGLVLLLLAWTFLPAAGLAAPGESRTINEMLDDSREGENTGTEEENRAEESGPQETEADAGSDVEMMEETSLASMLFRLVMALAAVIAIMYFLLKFINKRSQSFQSHKTMQNMGGVPLGQNKSVQLIKVGDRLLVVGVGDSIQLLKEIEEAEEMEELLDSNRAGRNETGFSKIQELLRNPLSKSGNQLPSSSFREVLEGELGEMKAVRKKARRRLKEHEQ